MRFILREVEEREFELPEEAKEWDADEVWHRVADDLSDQVDHRVIDRTWEKKEEYPPKRA